MAVVVRRRAHSVEQSGPRSRIRRCQCGRSRLAKLRFQRFPPTAGVPACGSAAADRRGAARTPARLRRDARRPRHLRLRAAGFPERHRRHSRHLRRAAGRQHAADRALATTGGRHRYAGRRVCARRTTGQRQRRCAAAARFSQSGRGGAGGIARRGATRRPRRDVGRTVARGAATGRQRQRRRIPRTAHATCRQSFHLGTQV